MPTLNSGLLPSNHVLLESSFLDRSTQKANCFLAKFEFQARNLGLKHAAVPNQSNLQAHLVAVAQPSKDCGYRSLQSANDVDEPFSLSNLFIRGRNYFYDCKQIHGHFVKMGSIESNILIGNKLAMLYLETNSLDDARRLFDEIPDRTVPLYALFIGWYSRSERWEELLFMLGLMIHDGMLPDKYLVPTIVKACSAVKLLRSGKMVHGYIVRKELNTDVFVGNALIDLYANCGDLRSSRSVFDSMCERDVVSWTALVSAYMDGGLLDEAAQVFRSLQLNGVKPDLIFWNALVAGFARNGEIDLSLRYLEEMKKKGFKPRVTTWNGLISGCVQSGYFGDALDVFSWMLSLPDDPNAVTIVTISAACAGIKDLNLGKAVHGYALKKELHKNIHVEGSLINTYFKCGRNDYAQKIFVKVVKKNVAVWNEMIAGYVNEGKIDSAFTLLRLMQNYGAKADEITFNIMLHGLARNAKKTEAFELLSEMSQMGLKPNIVSFNALISGLQQSGLSHEALKMFHIMQSHSSKGSNLEVCNMYIKPNPVTATGALAACADLGWLHQGKEIHGYVLRNGFDTNIFVTSALLDMYAKCLEMDSATRVFLKIEDRNTVTWNTLIAGHFSNNQPDKSLKLFHAMLDEGLEPSAITFMILLQACSCREALRFGRELHGYIIKSCLNEPNHTISSALIDMYAKCGCIEEAKLTFDSVTDKRTALWNAMISAYSAHGMTKNAICLFEQMERFGIAPDAITFFGLLRACIYGHLVDEGWKYFDLMKNTYRISPGLEHYTCMVCIMGAAGLLEKALDLIKQMPYAPDACIWTILLQACSIRSNLKIGERALKPLFELEGNDDAYNYLL